MPRSEVFTPADLKIGARIRDRRVEKDLTQAELSKLVGVTFQQIQKYENGSNRVAASRLLDISRALDVDVTWFYLDIDERLSPLATPSDHQYHVSQLGRLSAKLTRSDIELLMSFAKRLTRSSDAVNSDTLP